MRTQCPERVERKASESVPWRSTVPAWKRGLDLACILVALPVLVPVMLLIAAYIKLVSRGPVFFTQERVGFLGRTFPCYKFRSMRVNACAQAHEDYLRHLMVSDQPMIKMDTRGDSRLIPLGSILRATGVDELPQLINVLLGDMSIVGPRPCTRYEYAQYLPWHKHRLNTLPGLTGLWQVSGKNNTTFTEMMNLDIYYCENKSLWFDLQIMARTFAALARQVRETQAPPSVRDCRAGTTIASGLPSSN